MAARGLRRQMGLSGEDARQAAIALAVAPACLVVDRALPLRFSALGAQQRDLPPAWFLRASPSRPRRPPWASGTFASRTAPLQRRYRLTPPSRVATVAA